MPDSDNEQPNVADRLPVSVVTAYRTSRQTVWESGEWDVIGVVGAPVGADTPEGRTLIREEPREKQYIYSGYHVELFKDAAPGYYHNLMGDSPKAFVVCQQEEGEALEPFLVTVSWDEAAAHMEMDEAVYSVPLPPELYRFVEHFVLEHYVPEKRKKRKRKDWQKQEPPAHGPKRRHTAG